MNSIRQWIIAISVSSVIGGIILILSPKGSTEKAIRTAVSLVILCIMLTPFTSGIRFELPEFTTVINKENSEQSNIEMLKSTINEKVLKILSENGFINPEVSIDITTENNEITVHSVRISADSGDYVSAREQIKNELGIEVEIEVSDENRN